MEEHLNDSDKRVDVDNEISSHDIPEENSDVPDSRRGVSTEDDENSFPLEDGVEGGVTPLRVDDESNDSSRYNIPAIENHSNSSITEKMDSDEENVSLSVQTDDDDVDQNHTNDTSDNSEEDYQNETIESVVKVNENDRELALETPDDMDEKNQNLTIEPAAPDSLLGDIYNADDSVDKTGIQNADSSIEDSLQSKEEEFSEPEVTNGENSVSNEIKVQPEIDQENDVSVKSQSSTDESDFYGFDSATIEISVEKTNELMQTLSNKEGGIIRTNSLSGSTTPSNAEVDTNFIEAATVGDISNMISASDGQSIHIDGQTGENQTTALYADNQLKNSKKPNPVHPVLGVPVNIFDETLPSGSKRVKKKRKFFGDFEESDSEKASRKSSSSRPQEDGVKLLNNVNASGENKENFITDEKIKVESVTEGDTPRQNKGKRAYTFDISNPLLKEPFKFGWKREIYYRDLPEGSKSKLAYVSYYSPQNKKFKTIRQIVEHLPPGSELNTHHFTFSVQRIFNEPSEFEILREAKSRADLSNPESVNNDSFDVTSTSQSSAHFTPSENIKTIPKKKQSASSSRLVIKKPKYLRSTESEDDGAESLLLLSSTPSSTPKIVIKGASLNSAKANSSKSKFSSAKKEKKLSRKLEKSSKKSLPSAENVVDSTNSFDVSPVVSDSSKRKLSEDSDSSMAKIARLDDELPGYHYRSALTLSNVAQLYNSLTFCFKFLTVRDLLRVSMSCKYLNRIASEPDLWTTVRLKNSKVRDWEGFARTLRKYGTKKLDLRKILCPSAPADVNAMWNAFLDNIASVISLEHIEFSRCNAHVVEAIARTCPNLVVINAVQLRNGDSLSLENFTKLKYLKELRLKGGLSIELSDHGLTFQSKETIRLLSLTSIKKMDSSVVSAIGDLSELNTLELGECDGQLVNELAVSIGKLNNLHRLRLEQITNLDPDFKLFASLKNLPQLKSLELINVEIRIGYCEAIAECQNIENLLIIPLYKTESATSNRLIVDSLPSLSKSLKSFIWGLTHELIRATDLYANQFLDKPDGSNDESKKSPIKGHDSIPIVKRISKNPDVDIMSVRNLEKMLATMLPETRIKVIRVAFALTWRQNLSDLLK